MAPPQRFWDQPIRTGCKQGLNGFCGSFKGKDAEAKILTSRIIYAESANFWTFRMVQLISLQRLLGFAFFRLAILKGVADGSAMMWATWPSSEIEEGATGNSLHPRDATAGLQLPVGVCMAQRRQRCCSWRRWKRFRHHSPSDPLSNCDILTFDVRSTCAGYCASHCRTHPAIRSQSWKASR
jgi:hypothetical protein